MNGSDSHYISNVAKCAQIHSGRYCTADVTCMTHCACTHLRWLDLWVRPSCCTALSALQGNSIVMCTRRRSLLQLVSEWREIPVLAASEMMATSFPPSMKDFLWLREDTQLKVRATGNQGYGQPSTLHTPYTLATCTLLLIYSWREHTRTQNK